METYLEAYQVKEQAMRPKMAPGTPSDLLWEYQEIVYRIDVLQSISAFSKAAPVSMDRAELGQHYLMLDAYIHSLTIEHRFGFSIGDSEVVKRRKTAYQGLQRIAADCRIRFVNYAPQHPGQYREDIRNRMIAVIIPVWLLYRDTIIKVQEEKCNDV